MTHKIRGTGKTICGFNNETYGGAYPQKMHFQSNTTCVCVSTSNMTQSQTKHSPDVNVTTCAVAAFMAAIWELTFCLFVSSVVSFHFRDAYVQIHTGTLVLNLVPQTWPSKLLLCITVGLGVFTANRNKRNEIAWCKHKFGNEEKLEQEYTRKLSPVFW